MLGDWSGVTLADDEGVIFLAFADSISLDVFGDCSGVEFANDKLSML